MVQIKVRIGNADDVYIPVQTAIEGKVCHLGIHRVIGCIVHSDDDHRLHTDLLGDVTTPGGVATVMMGVLLAIDVQISRGIGAVDLNVVALCLRQVFLVQFLGINGRTAVVVIAAVLSIQSVPGMGQADKIPLGVNGSGDFCGLLGECPFAIDTGNRSQCCFLP